MFLATFCGIVCVQGVRNFESETSWMMQKRKFVVTEWKQLFLVQLSKQEQAMQRRRMQLKESMSFRFC